MPLKPTTIAINSAASSKTLTDPPAAPGGSAGNARLPDIATALPESVSAADVQRRNREKWGQ